MARRKEDPTHSQPTPVKLPSVLLYDTNKHGFSGELMGKATL